MGMVAHAFNPSTWEAEAGEFLSSRLTWSTEWVPGQPGLHRETLSRKTKKKKKKKKKIYLFNVYEHTVADTPEEGTGSNYRWSWATMWLLGIELMTSGRAVSECS